jgi:nicotinamide-nucleotide amidase
MTFPPDIPPLANAVLEACRVAKLVIATAESCTSGLIAAALTEWPGSSSVFVQGFVTYSNEAKMAMLGVAPECFAPGGPGAVSEIVARQMAQAAAQRAVLPQGSKGCVAVSVTGIAGPDGGSDEKPVGTVHFAVASSVSGYVLHHACHFQGDRSEVRHASVRHALEMLSDYLKAL